MRRPTYSTVAAALAAAGACAAAGTSCITGEQIDLGRNVDGGAALVDGASVTGDGPAVEEPIPTSNLVAGFSLPMGSTICAGSCIDLIATVSGGTGPFVYSWGQGLGEGRGPKTVCPIASTEYSVMVSSLSSVQESSASVPVTVIACDGGSMAAKPDSGAGPPDDAGHGSTPSSLCVPNPSLEGTPSVGMTGPPGSTPIGVPPQWQVCQGAPDVDPALSLLPASDGKTYAGLAVGTGSLAYLTASIGTTLCASLTPGTTYSFCMDLGIGVRGVMVPLTMGAPAPALELYGGTAPCNEDALLWTSPPITNTDTWTMACGTFVATQALSTLRLMPAQGSAGIGPGTGSYVIVDHITAGP